MKKKLNILLLLNFLSNRISNTSNNKNTNSKIQSLKNKTSSNKQIIKKINPKINHLNKISKKLIRMPRKNPYNRYINVNGKCICIDNCQCSIIPPFLTF